MPRVKRPVCRLCAREPARWSVRYDDIERRAHLVVPYRHASAKYCRRCANQEIRDRERYYALRHKRADQARARGQVWSFRTDTPVPRYEQQQILLKALRRLGPAEDPHLPWLDCMVREGYVFVDVYPPRKAGKAWNPIQALSLVRQWAMLPLLFVEIDPDESPSRYGRHIWAKRLDAIATKLTAQAGSTPPAVTARLPGIGSASAPPNGPLPSSVPTATPDEPDSPRQTQALSVSSGESSAPSPSRSGPR